MSLIESMTLRVVESSISQSLSGESGRRSRLASQHPTNTGPGKDELLPGDSRSQVMSTSIVFFPSCNGVDVFVHNLSNYKRRVIWAVINIPG